MNPCPAILCLSAATLFAALSPAQLRVQERARHVDHGLASVDDGYWDPVRNVSVLRQGRTVVQYDGPGRVARDSAPCGDGAAMCPFPGNPLARLEHSREFGTRKFENGTWTQLSPGGFQPLAMMGSHPTWHRMVFDTARQRAVLAVTRYGPTSTTLDYHEFDGTDWHWLNRSSMPAAPLAMTFDRGRGRTVVVDINHQHWEWDGSIWLRFGPVPVDLIRGRVLGVGYDGLRNSLLLLHDAWVFATAILRWNGSAWVPLPTSNTGAPVLYDRPTLIHDDLRGEWQVFGNTTSGQQAWIWNGGAWAQRTALTDRPPARNDAMMTDLVAGALLFGGRDGNGVHHNGTWLFDGSRWFQSGFLQAPPARSAGALARHGSGGNDAVLFGGLGAGNAALQDTWLYSVSTGWQALLLSSAPPARYNHTLAFDPVTARTWLFGGTNGTTWFGDLRWLDLRAFPQLPIWREVTTTVAPQARDSHSLACDETRRKLVLFGGHCNGQVFSDTWEFDLVNQTWQDRSAPIRPTARWNAAMVYDPLRGHTVLLGGYDPLGFRYLGDIWEWNGSFWRQRQPETASFRGTENLAACYDRNRRTIVAFGGQQDFSAPPVDQTWEIEAYAIESALGQTLPIPLQVTGRPAVAQTNTVPLRLRVPGYGAFVIFGLNQAIAPHLILTPPTTCVAQTLYVEPAVTAFVPEATEYVLPIRPAVLGATLSAQALTLTPAGCWSLTTAWHVRVRLAE